MRKEAEAHFNFQARIPAEVERLRRKLQRKLKCSNGTLVERGLRRLEDDASEQSRTEAAA
jgi:hypothetical protein